MPKVTNRYSRTIKNDTLNNSPLLNNPEISISGAGVSTEVRNNNDMTPFSIMKATEYLGISRSMLYRLLDKRDIDSFHIGARRFISKSALDSFIRKQVEAESYGW